MRRDLLAAGLVGALGYVGFPGRTTADHACQDAGVIQLPRLYRVPLGVQTGRLHEMEASDDGCLWFWSGVGELLLRYDPRTGETERHVLRASERPELHREFIGRHFYPLGKAGKIYLSDLRMASHHLPIYDPTARRVTFAPLPPSQHPRFIYKGHSPKHGPYIYLFVKEPASIIQWDTRSDSGKIIPYPYGSAGPWWGELAADGRSLWCPLWDANAIARCDVTKGEWTGHWPTPFEHAQPTSGGLIGPTYYAPDLLEPRVLAFDTTTEKWGEPVAVPGHRRWFGILGGGLTYNSQLYCPMNTYKGYIPPGGPLGVDGKPHHFLDRWLCYDPRNRAFAHLVCDGSDQEYWLTCYGVAQGKHLYLTAFNALGAGGLIDQGNTGDAAVFQTHPSGQSELRPELVNVPPLSSS